MPKKITPEQPDFENALAASLGEEQPEQIEENSENPTDNIQDYGFSMPQPSTMDKIGAGLAGLGEGLSAAQAVKGPNTGAMQAGAAFKAAFGMASGLLKERTEALNMALERLPLSDVSPALAKKFPSLAGMPSKMAYETIRDIQTATVKGKVAVELQKERLAQQAKQEPLAVEEFTPEAVETYAQKAAVTGQIPSFGMGKNAVGAKIKVMNRAAQIMREKGKTGEALAMTEAAYKATSSALASSTRYAQQVFGFENTASKNLDLAEELSGKFNRSKVPLINRALIAGQTQIAGDPAATQFLNAVQTFQNEYAKVMSGSMGSAAATDFALKEAQKLINAAMNKEQFKAAAAVSRREMHNRRMALSEEIQNLMGTIGSDGVSALGSSKQPEAQKATPQIPEGTTATKLINGKPVQLTFTKGVWTY